MHKSFFVMGLLVLVLSTACSGKKETPSPESENLTAWQAVGIGAITSAPDGVGYRLTEGADSKGVTFVSPQAYGKNVTLSFKVMPEKREGVCVVFLSAADSTGQLSIPPDNDGSLGLWSESPVHNYMIAFHTAFHQPNLFIRKHPGAVDLALTADVAGEEKWYDIEIGRNGSRIWVTVDGVSALEATDPEETGLPGGKIGLRLRGPGDGSFSCLVKDVVIKDN